MYSQDAAQERTNSMTVGILASSSSGRAQPSAQAGPSGGPGGQGVSPVVPWPKDLRAQVQPAPPDASRWLRLHEEGGSRWKRISSRESVCWASSRIPSFRSSKSLDLPLA
jgi:hypothetical protein